MLWHRCLMSFTRRPPFVDLTDCVSEEDLAAVSESSRSACLGASWAIST